MMRGPIIFIYTFSVAHSLLSHGRATFFCFYFQHLQKLGPRGSRIGGVPGRSTRNFSSRLTSEVRVILLLIKTELDLNQPGSPPKNGLLGLRTGNLSTSLE